ncbi:immunoglobulin superfamily containing leucine-rich repeat protein-like isoform X2 [Periplaneta americana]|uniref:immunoglobulin superfamily containing leucine-rich repeat protein-like isoform X2 n=1 Tax=Periplaneta americana TaxID=6978 RepID=UPI0037E7EC02
MVLATVLVMLAAVLVVLAAVLVSCIVDNSERTMDYTWWWKGAMVLAALDLSTGCGRFFTKCKYYDVTKTVNCSNIHLGSLEVKGPSSLSRKLQRLHLRNTHLTTLEDNVFNAVPNLWFLDLSDNFLSELDYRLFNKLTKLLFLDLTNNKLSLLKDERIFKSQYRLSSLLLSNNAIEAVSVAVFNPLKSLKTLKLSDNPFICNCELRLSVLWCVEKELDTNAICEHPSNYAGSPWSVLNSTNICDENETGTTIKYVEIFKSNVSSVEVEGDSSRNFVNSSATLIIVTICVSVVLLCVGFVTLYIWKRNSTSRGLTEPSVVFQRSLNEELGSAEHSEQSTVHIHLSQHDLAHISQLEIADIEGSELSESVHMASGDDITRL